MGVAFFSSPLLLAWSRGLSSLTKWAWKESEDWRQSRPPCGQKQKTLECFFFSSSSTRLLSWPTSFKQQNSPWHSMDSFGSWWSCRILEEEKYRNTKHNKGTKTGAAQETLFVFLRLCVSTQVHGPGAPLGLWKGQFKLIRRQQPATIFETLPPHLHWANSVLKQSGANHSGTKWKCRMPAAGRR